MDDSFNDELKIRIENAEQRRIAARDRRDLLLEKKNQLTVRKEELNDLYKDLLQQLSKIKHQYDKELVSMKIPCFSMNEELMNKYEPLESELQKLAVEEKSNVDDYMENLEKIINRQQATMTKTNVEFIQQELSSLKNDIESVKDKIVNAEMEKSSKTAELAKLMDKKQLHGEIMEDARKIRLIVDDEIKGLESAREKSAELTSSPHDEEILTQQQRMTSDDEIRGIEAQTAMNEKLAELKATKDNLVKEFRELIY